MPESGGDRSPKVTAELLIRRRHLPHWQMGGSTYFITFRSTRGCLPSVALKQICSNILFDHGKRYDLVVGVVMPDHVHLILHPLQKSEGTWFDLSEILKGLKGASARRINQILGTQGSVWQDESFDQVIRNDREFEEILRYILENPLKAGLAAKPEEYEFFVWPPVRNIGQTGSVWPTKLR